MDYSDLSDSQIIEIIIKKDQEAFSELISRYQNKIFAYVYRLVNGDKFNAQDLTQEVFIKAFKNLNGFDLSKNFSSWVYRIAHNHTINHLKKHSGKTLSIDNENGLENILVSESKTLEEIERKEKKIQVKKLLEKLPNKYKEVLILRYFEELSYEEIADALGKPKNTVGTLINRAKENLKKYIDNEDEIYV